MSTMYETLLQLPLFQGLSKDVITRILTKVRFHFVKFKAGQEIVKYGNTPKDLIYVLEGEVTAYSAIRMENQKGCNNIFKERIKGPLIIEPSGLFGRCPSYRATYKAATEVQVLTIEKTYLLNFLFQLEIFSLNYINILCSQSQHYASITEYVIDRDIRRRIIRFIQGRSIYIRGEKEINILMVDLAEMLGCTRLKLSKALNSLEDMGFITLHRGGFTVKNFIALNESMDNFNEEDEDEDIN